MSATSDTGCRMSQPAGFMLPCPSLRAPPIAAKTVLSSSSVPSSESLVACGFSSLSHQTRRGAVKRALPRALIPRALPGTASTCTRPSSTVNTAEAAQLRGFLVDLRASLPRSFRRRRAGASASCGPDSPMLSLSTARLIFRARARGFAHRIRCVTGAAAHQPSFVIRVRLATWLTEASPRPYPSVLPACIDGHATVVLGADEFQSFNGP